MVTLKQLLDFSFSWKIIVVLLLFAFFFLSQPFPVHSAGGLNISDSVSNYKLGSFLDILEDEGGALSFEDVRGKYSEQFVPSQNEVPNFGFTSSAYWVRFTLTSHLPAGTLYYLKIGYPLLDRIDIYLPSAEKGYSHVEAGDHFPFNQRRLKNSDFVFELFTPFAEPQTYYARFETTSAMNLPIELSTPSGFSKHVGSENMMLGIFFGILFAMMVHNFFVLLSTRDAAYAYYILFVACNIIFQFTMKGLTFQYLWPNQVWWANNCIPIIILACYLSAAEFTRHALMSKSNTPKLDRVLRWLNFGAGVCLLASFFVNYAVSVKIATAFILTVPLFIFIGIRCLQQGYRPAFYYCIAWGISLIGYFVYSLKSFGVLPHNFITHYGIQIGSAWEVVLFSMGLADRYNFIKKQQAELQVQHAVVLEKANLDLENINEKLDAVNKELHQTIGELSSEIEVRKSIEKTLQESERTARVLIDTPFNLAALLEVDGTVINVNKTLADYLGKQPADLAGTLCFDHYKDNGAFPGRFEHLQEAVSSGEIVRFEDGWGGKWFDNVYAPILDQTGRVLRVSMVSRDITERIESEKIRQEMEVKAISQAKLASLGQIATGIAHEINQPLSYIKIIFESALRDIDNDCFDVQEMREDALESLRQVFRITTIISHLRTFGRADGKEFEPVSIADIYQNSMILMRERLFLRDVFVVTDFADELPLVNGNKVQLEQVFINLLQNSLDAINESGGGGKVTIRSFKRDEDVVIEYSDDGPGFGDFGDKIFEPFFTTKPPGEGTGLGLSISYGIIREHNGVMACREAGGAFFEIVLPAIGAV